MQNSIDYKGFTIAPNNNDGGYIVTTNNGYALTLSVKTVLGAKRIISKYLACEVYELALNSAQRAFMQASSFMSYADCDLVFKAVYALINNTTTPHAMALQVAAMADYELVDLVVIVEPVQAHGGVVCEPVQPNHYKAVVILTKLKKQIVRLGIPCTLDDYDLLELIKASNCDFLAALNFIQAINKEKGLRL